MNEFRSRLGHVVLVVAGVGLAALPVTARQAAPQALFRATTQVVPVDAVVVDKDGRHVYGLTAADFAISDRKKRQTISTFTEVSEPASSATPAPPASAGNVRMDVVSNQVAAPDRLVVVVVDDLHIYKARTDRSKDLARQVVSALGPPAAMAVLFTSGDHSTTVTRDSKELLDAIDTLKGRRQFRRPTPAEDTQTVKIDPEDDVQSVMDKLQTANRKQLSDFFDNMTQYKTLQDAARMLGGEDTRRKAFVLISEGIGKDLTGVFDGGVSDVTPCEAKPPQRDGSRAPCYHDIALRQMMAQMWRGHVATYAIDPRGHVGPEDLAREAFPDPTPGLGDDPASGGINANNPIRWAQNGLSIMAEASGGLAITNTDDYTDGLHRIVDDIGHYYLLGFSPSDPTGKGPRPIEVTIPGHPDWKVRFRKSYDPAPPPPAPGDEDPRAALANGVLPKAGLPLSGYATARPGDAKEAHVVVALEARIPTRAMATPDGQLHDAISYAVFAVDLKSGKIVKSAGNTATVTSAHRPALGDTIPIQVPINLMLPPGRYQLRLTAMSTALGKGGSVYVTIDVPDFSKNALALSALTVGYADGAHTPVAKSPAMGPAAAAAGAVADAPEAIVPSLDREFTRADTLRVYAEFTRVVPATSVRATIEISDADGKTVATVNRTVTVDALGRVDETLPLARLAPGAYRLRVTVTDRTSTVRRDVGFVVK